MAAVTRADFAPILLHRKELRRRDRLEPPVQWMLDMTGSSLFTPLVPGPGTTILDKQNYQRWKVIFGSYKFAHPKRSKRRLIVLQPLAYTSPDYPMAQVETVLLESLAGFCSVYFTGMEVVLDQPPLELSGVKKITKRVHRTTQREQLLVGDVTKYMKSQSQIKSFCIVGITLVDLYPSPNWNFTLGEASFSDGLAVCSFGRHFNSQLDGESPAASDLKKQINNMWVLIRVSC
ncbi:PREDICTED: archaemetzincin-2-like [Amphimedon queenslandica]|uniref:Uncharacterized protein n=2 Tax=Amphimedon queenslandica TaxID=400682 RepID=A0AAN0JS30_AMPQE|nr:PREDICTED: archaemetzincin-2-like [Amphimedon queenslandica]|eukprot:XP_019859628.1 PREDICTED: archaemetzincin-2-like [Amphimedon queenslandica]